MRDVGTTFPPDSYVVRDVGTTFPPDSYVVRDVGTTFSADECGDGLRDEASREPDGRRVPPPALPAGRAAAV